MNRIDYDALNPGIRETVRMLRDHGFDTCDSGDGETAEFECDPGFPYVHMTVDPVRMVQEADRLLEIMRPLIDFDRECLTDDEMMIAPGVEASYHPKPGVAVLSVMNVCDRDWIKS